MEIVSKSYLIFLNSTFLARPTDIFKQMTLFFALSKYTNHLYRLAPGLPVPMILRL